MLAKKRVPKPGYTYVRVRKDVRDKIKKLARKEGKYLEFVIENILIEYVKNKEVKIDNDTTKLY